ncbi:ribosomal-processing cysteine protease Prp [Faecalispora sporosphaeroides]|uniref:Ribosomal processing cysteine protease Prp n=2 Tax=Faecalispora sporosphaeroides TaxID=1549 RepID=A0A928KTX9_9FIRM|nr:ribosomal-processing cysteine protease Prp [Faecalispora sporosphaeroides]MBE6832871.1 ribosomal-processing cysteine protease Prp [Faecalispora sporosphaeroides]
MIQVLFLQQPDGELLGFHMTGHSGLAQEGSDILCAAVSSAAYLVANAITDVVQVKAELSVAQGDMSLQIPERAVFLCRTLLQGLRLHLTGLQEQYPDNIRINFTEV